MDGNFDTVKTMRDVFLRKADVVHGLMNSYGQQECSSDDILDIQPPSRSVIESKNHEATKSRRSRDSREEDQSKDSPLHDPSKEVLRLERTYNRAKGLC